MENSVRDAFFYEVYELVKKGQDIYLITADLGAPSLDAFRTDFPDRYISVGIAEQNLIAVAAGMALGGKKVIAYGLNPFPVTRAFDQIRCLMAELKIPMTVCCLNAGLCSAECGYTHMPIEDMAMLRTLSNIEIYNPTDESVSQKLAKETVHSKAPRVIRFDKALKGKIYEENKVDFDRGFSVLGCQGKAKVGVFSYGSHVRQLYDEWCARKEFSSVKIVDIYKLPVDENALISEISNCEVIISLEENVKAGGLGSLLLEILSDHSLVKPITRYGVDVRNGYYDVFTNRDLIRKTQKIDIEYIIKVIEDYLK